MSRRNSSIALVAFVFSVGLMVVAAAPAHPPAQSMACPKTYCVFVSATISIGGSETLQPVLAIMSTIQLVGVAFTLFQAFVLLVAVGNRIPLSLLGAMSHLRGLDSAPSRVHLSTSPVFWLPIESISAGRLTAKMLKTPNFFGAGRPRR